MKSTNRFDPESEISLGEQTGIRSPKTKETRSPKPRKQWKWFYNGLQKFLFTLESPNPDAATSYENWQHQFMHKRLTLGLGLTALYFFTFALLGIGLQALMGQTLSTSALTNLLIALTCFSLLSGLQTRWGDRHQNLMFLGLSWSITILTDVPETLAGTVDPDLIGWTMAFFGQATIIPLRWQLHLVAQLGTLAYYFGVNGALGLDLFPNGMNPTIVIFDLFWICFLANLAVSLYEHRSRLEFMAQQQLKEEQQRSERLLLNILPETVADRLMTEDQRIIADNFSDVSVLFADIVNFTQLSNQMPPKDIVHLLNQIFSMFDQLAQEYNLEKIKTIGDAYMVVAGLPHYRPDHAQAIAKMSLAMQQSLTSFNRLTNWDLSIRIGIHTGPVVAGVIGLKKFAYDLWGDTVNIASRMESLGIPGKIQVTRATYDCIKTQYHLVERGKIYVKGKGDMTTYFLQDKK